jgi:proteic killer suppression protein
MAIQSFSDAATEKFFITGKVWPKIGWFLIRNVAKRKLDMVHYAARLSDLKVPPGNRLEDLKGNLAGFHSIRVNDQWRVVFRWTESGPIDVSVMDYH